MNKNELINRIRNKNILQNIFQYIQIENFKLNLFLYSKHFRKQLNIQLEEYQEILLRKKNINLSNYLNLEKNPKYAHILTELKKKKINNPYLVDFILKSQLANDLLNNRIDIKINKRLVMNYFIKYLKTIEDEYEYAHFGKYDYLEEVIDINCPFFNELLENEMIKYFSIFISINGKLDSKIKTDYSSVFDKLNESKSKYSSITVNINNNTNLNDLNQFKIDFKQIKRLTIKTNEEYEYKKGYSSSKKNIINYNVCYGIGLEKNLLYLNLTNKLDKNIKIDYFLNLDNFTSLEHLVLNGFFFDKILEIKLKNLKIIKIQNTKYIKLDFENYLNIKEFYFLIDHYINLKEWNDYYSIINMRNFKNLKYLNINIDKNKEIEYKIWEIIFSIKSLEYIDVSLNNVINDNILRINGQNSSVKNLIIKYYLHYKDIDSIYFLLYNLQCKFPNINNLSFLSSENELDYIVYDDFKKMKIEGVKLEIIENRNFKIEKIILKINYYIHIKLFCGSLDQLIVLDIECINWNINNIENSFPIFSNKCPILKNLKHFRLKTFLIGYKVLNNIYNNIKLKCLPNLAYFELYCFTKDSIGDLYMKLIIQLLSLNIDEIYFGIKKYEKDMGKIIFQQWKKLVKFDERKSNDDEIQEEADENDELYLLSSKEYSKSELKEFYPPFNLNNKKLHIKKTDYKLF